MGHAWEEGLVAQRELWLVTTTSSGEPLYTRSLGMPTSRQSRLVASTAREAYWHAPQREPMGSNDAGRKQALSAQGKHLGEKSCLILVNKAYPRRRRGCVSSLPCPQRQPLS